jgi:hypothetical protein
MALRVAQRHLDDGAAVMNAMDRTVAELGTAVV